MLGEAHLFSNKCTRVYLITLRRDVIGFWRKSLQDYCSVCVYPELGLFLCSLGQREQYRNALVIIDSCSVINADEEDFFRLGKVFSFNKVFIIEPSLLKNDVLCGFEFKKANLIPFPCDFASIKSQIKLNAALDLVKTEPSEKQDVPAPLKRFAGNSFVVESLRSSFFTFGKTDLPILLQGETGTGKTFAAELIHSISGRSGKKFRRINMPCIQEEIVESEFFGTVPGAFTGAVNKKGILEDVNGGTILFDEISEIPLRFQAKLLKFLDSGSFNRVGSNQENHADVRIISATNVNLEEMVEKKLFRKDLYERLKGKVISLPSLNSHKEDIESLVQDYLLENGYSNITFTPEAISALQQRDWSGNVRELHYCLELTCSVTDKKVIGPEDLIFAS